LAAFPVFEETFGPRRGSGSKWSAPHYRETVQAAVLARDWTFSLQQLTPDERKLLETMRGGPLEVGLAVAMSHKVTVIDCANMPAFKLFGLPAIPIVLVTPDIPEALRQHPAEWVARRARSREARRRVARHHDRACRRSCDRCGSARGPPPIAVPADLHQGLSADRLDGRAASDAGGEMDRLRKDMGCGH
jgi:hypothetical protein